jgi:acyl-CoA synthetase (AMP-forming)/AMP-acid ligase II
MLGKLIFEEELPGSRRAVVTPTHTTMWAGLREESQRFFETHGNLSKRRVGLSFQASTESYAALAALDRLSCDVFLFDSHLRFEEAIELSSRLKLSGLLTAEPSAHLKLSELPDEELWSGDSTITILTSGSTGKPKAARHSWESMSRPIRRGFGSGAAWLLTYRPNLYAGLQVMLQCFAEGGTLVVPEPDMDPKSTARFMVEAGVQYVSATPSYWRRLLMFSDLESLKRVPLLQITLGGEVIDQTILNNLRRCFPMARLVHIYATTELGRCFSVSDGRAGFPAKYLENPLPDGTALKVHEGELLVRSPNRMRTYDPLSSHPSPSSLDWFATGDMVDVKEDRIYFVGRKTEMINVAGSKVFPIEVERVIRIVPGVSDVRVFGKSSSIAGELVACEIVAAPDQDREALKSLIVRTCRASLASHQQPRIIKLVDRIDLSSAGKTLRAKTS